MKDYPDNFPWFDVLILCAHLLAAAISVLGVVYYFTHITPDREVELKAQGAAEADRKAEAAGGWSAWVAGEVSAAADGKVKVEGEGEQRKTTSTVHLKPSPSPNMEVL